MVIERVEQLEDRVRVHFWFRNGLNIKDEEDTKDILYDQIPTLKKEPELVTDTDGKYWAESFFVEKVGKTVDEVCDLYFISRDNGVRIMRFE